HAAPDQTVTAWSHGDHPAARQLAAKTKLKPVRLLYRMAIDLAAESFGDAAVPQGYTIRTFQPGTDDHAWLQLNATACADHPEQGQLTQADLDASKAEDRSDPAGFFIAVDAEAIPFGCHLDQIPLGSLVGDH